MAEAELRHVTKAFGDTVAISDLSLHIDDGEFVVLLGPTGAGKTTTLRLLAGLEIADSGIIEIGGKDVTRVAPAQRDVSFVFQQYSLYPHYSVFENLAFPLRAPGRKLGEPAIKKRVHEIAELLRIETKLANKSTELSGGEMQRVSIGRALVREPNLFLMDEPLSSLDAKLREDLRIELKRIQRDLGATVVYVTHDHLEAMTLADRIGILREGHLDQIDVPRIVYNQPASVYAAQRLGSPQINLVSAALLGDADVPAGATTLGVRPEDIELGRDGTEATVLTVENLGAETIVLLQVGAAQMHALVNPQSTHAPGDEVQIAVRPGTKHYFDSVGSRLEVANAGPCSSSKDGPKFVAQISSRPMNCSTTRARRNGELIACMARAIEAAIVDHEADIEGLDRAIGDGDHFINMKRGSQAIVGMLDELKELPPEAALKAIAKKLLMTVGGASGPLVASFFLDMSKTADAAGNWDVNACSRMFRAGVEAIKRRGKADLGDKTMLDVLIPVADRLEEMAASGTPLCKVIDELPAVAERGMLATRGIQARFGRAAFLGERAVGHIDPGAKTSAVIIDTACNALREKSP